MLGRPVATLAVLLCGGWLELGMSWLNSICLPVCLAPLVLQVWCRLCVHCRYIL